MCAFWRQDLQYPVALKELRLNGFKRREDDGAGSLPRVGSTTREKWPLERVNGYRNVATASAPVLLYLST
jgi:hypothetical protein